MADKTFYWLKMSRNFMKKHSIKILRKQQNGPEMVNFFLCLLLESIDHDGELRYSEDIPYTYEDLAIVTETDLEVVECAMSYFLSKGLVEITDDETIVIPMAEEMIGKESASAERVRKHRTKTESLENTECNADVTQVKRECNADVTPMKRECNKNVTQSKSKSKSIEIELEEAEDNIHTLKEFTQGDLLQLRQYWNMQKCTQNIDSIKPLTKRYDNLKLCMAGRTKDQLIGEIMRIDSQAFFQKISAENRPVKFDWFFNPNNFQKVIEGNYKDDYAKKSDEGYEVFEL